jgi:hypothetical protein
MYLPRPLSLSRLICFCACCLVVGCGGRSVGESGSDGGVSGDASVSADATPQPRWIPTPMTPQGEVYALWASEDGSSVWATGRRAPMSPIVWRFDGTRFVEATPSALRSRVGTRAA